MGVHGCALVFVMWRGARVCILAYVVVSMSHCMGVLGIYVYCVFGGRRVLRACVRTYVGDVWVCAKFLGCCRSLQNKVRVRMKSYSFDLSQEYCKLFLQMTANMLRKAQEDLANTDLEKEVYAQRLIKVSFETSSKRLNTGKIGLCYAGVLPCLLACFTMHGIARVTSSCDYIYAIAKSVASPKTRLTHVYVYVT